MVNKLKETLSQKSPEYLDYLKELIAIDTRHIGQGIEGGYEAAGQEYLIQLMEKIGAESIERDQMKESFIQQAIEEYNEGNPGHNYDDRYNVYATFKGADESETLMFNSHIDTMTPGPSHLWQTDPHTPTEKDGNLIGLGAADMKSGLMASILAVKLIQDAGIDLPVNVQITSVVDEEGGGNGSIQAALVNDKVNGVVVCEPSNYDLILAHMGFIFFRIEVEGKAHHSGSKWLGVSAIDKISLILERLRAVEYDWLFNYKHPLLPPPNVNFGVIQGGTSGATVAGYCLTEMCIHYHPKTMSYESVKSEIEQAVDAVVQSDDWLKENPPKVTIFQSGGGYEMDEEDKLVQHFKSAYQSALDKEVTVTGSPAGCDSRIWRNILDVPTIQYGPGRLEECHAPNEYVEIQQFFDAILIYAELILNWKGRV